MSVKKFKHYDKVDASHRCTVCNGDKFTVGFRVKAVPRRTSDTIGYYPDSICNCCRWDKKAGVSKAERKRLKREGEARANELKAESIRRASLTKQERLREDINEYQRRIYEGK